MSQDFEKLLVITESFFKLHWPSEWQQAPCWSEPFLANSSGPIPNHDKQGCYALFENESLAYVGVGASRGGGIYKGHGLGARLKHVVRVNWASEKRVYMPQEKWASISTIRTIGFSPKTGYLALALESYLLFNLEPTPRFNYARQGSI